MKRASHLDRPAKAPASDSDDQALWDVHGGLVELAALLEFADEHGDHLTGEAAGGVLAVLGISARQAHDLADRLEDVMHTRRVGAA
jgi:hypothetical protein